MSTSDERTERPNDETAHAVGLMTEALETTERARGHLHSFHQLTGEADFKLGDAIDSLRSIGQGELAEQLETELLGRNVLPDRWTFQIIEEYDDTYWSVFRAWEKKVREDLTDGDRHVHEARLKEQRRTHDHPDHTAGP